jgi:hypothetical protein
MVKFNVPKDAPQGNAILLWSWVNMLGNREYCEWRPRPRAS